MIPVFALGLLTIYLLRPFIVALFLTDDFVRVEDLFGWQLLGDFVKILAIVIAYQFIAKKMVRNFIFTEILSLALFYFSARYLVNFYGIEGVVMAHLIRSVIMLVVVFYLVFRYFNKQKISENSER